MNLTYAQRLSISADARKEWYRALAKVAADGLPIFAALEHMGREFAKTHHPLTPLVEVVVLRLRGAGAAKQGAQRRTLGTELAGMVPDDEAMLIQAGDLSGRIAEGLANAASLVETKGQLAASITGALLKPIGYAAAMIGLLVFFAVSLLPRFEKTRPRVEWPGSAQMLGTVADNVVWIAGGATVALIVALAGLKWVVPRWSGEARDWCDEHLFPFNLIAAINGASFLSSIAGYIAAGTPFIDAVSNVQATGTPYMRSQCGKLLDLMKRGRRPEEALCQLAIVPARYHWIISVYAMSGDAARAYQTIAKEMVRGVQAFINRLFGWVVSNVLLAAIGFMLFWIYGSMFAIATSGNSHL